MYRYLVGTRTASVDEKSFTDTTVGPSLLLYCNFYHHGGHFLFWVPLKNPEYGSLDTLE